jgi:phosphate transport system substrate-binding protein
MPRARLGAVAVAAASLMLVAACSTGGASPSSGQATSEPAATEATGSAPSSLEGTIAISGSSTVQPITSAIAEAFNGENPDVAISVDGPGTGDGFKLFCAGTTDISDASRKIKDEEAATCKAAGIDYIELKIAIDGISVLTSKENTALTCLSFADLYALIGEESQGFKTWAEAQALAKELGSNTTFPSGPLVIEGPGEESGTYDSFIELALKTIATGRGKTGTATRPDYTSSANDNAIIEGIANTATSLGWVGFAYAQENADKVSEIAISKDPNGTCVAPNPDTIASGDYPLSRDLYIYVNKGKLAENPALAPFVDYYLADGTISTALETVPYINLTPEELAASVATWTSSH